MTEQELILALCREAGDDVSDPDAVEDAFRGNHSGETIIAAARGDVLALVQLRINCGLPVFS